MSVTKIRVMCTWLYSFDGYHNSVRRCRKQCCRVTYDRALLLNYYILRSSSMVSDISAATSFPVFISSEEQYLDCSTLFWGSFRLFKLFYAVWELIGKFTSSLILPILPQNIPYSLSN